MRLQEIADIEYIPLETTDEVLLGQALTVSYVSDQYIVIYDRMMSNIFVFNRNGKIVNHFNHRGQGDKEYNRIASLVFDEKNEDIFVFDVASTCRIQVYSLTGEFKRTLKYSNELDITGCNFDDETMLVYDTKGLFQNEYSEQPYMLMSKKDGSIVSGLDIIMPVRYSNRGILTSTNESGQQVMQPITISSSNNRYFGQDLVIADFSSDTIYRLTKSRELTPFAVRTPSVHSSEPRTVWAIGLTTDKFILISKVTLDFEAVRRTQSVSSATFFHEFKTGETSEASFVNDDFLSWNFQGFHNACIPQKNIAVSLIQMVTLKDALEEKQLKGELEKLVATLDEEDNPVVMLVKFR
jgi:hypothetical protein